MAPGLPPRLHRAAPVEEKSSSIRRCRLLVRAPARRLELKRKEGDQSQEEGSEEHEDRPREHWGAEERGGIECINERVCLPLRLNIKSNAGWWLELNN